jgi:hypothetical protein
VSTFAGFESLGPTLTSRRGWVRRYGRREEEALGHCAGRPGPDVRTSPSLARHQRTPQNPRVTCSPWKPAAASSNASRARAARKVFATRQPTMRRENTSVMNVAYVTRDHQFWKPAAGRDSKACSRKNGAAVDGRLVGSVTQLRMASSSAPPCDRLVSSGGCRCGLDASTGSGEVTVAVAVRGSGNAVSAVSPTPSCALDATPEARLDISSRRQRFRDWQVRQAASSQGPSTAHTWRAAAFDVAP